MAFDLGTFFDRIFTPPGTGGIQSALQQGQADLTRQGQIAQAASDRALALQTAALKRAEAAAVPVIDSESARVAAEERMRKLIAAGAFGVQAGQNFLGEAPTGYRMLTGA